MSDSYFQQQFLHVQCALLEYSPCGEQVRSDGDQMMAYYYQKKRSVDFFTLYTLRRRLPDSFLKLLNIYMIVWIRLWRAEDLLHLSELMVAFVYV